MRPALIWSQRRRASCDASALVTGHRLDAADDGIEHGAGVPAVAPEPGVGEVRGDGGGDVVVPAAGDQLVDDGVRAGLPAAPVPGLAALAAVGVAAGGERVHAGGLVASCGRVVGDLHGSGALRAISRDDGRLVPGSFPAGAEVLSLLLGEVAIELDGLGG